MESALRNVFEYQRFERNMGLQQIINDVHTRYRMRKLDLEEVEMVSAAGQHDVQLLSMLRKGQQSTSL